MNNLISAQEAFNAMLAGKNVMCRAMGEMLDFNDIDQFPATIFAKPDYEFCIKIEMINVAGIAFTKPLTLDEYQEGQDVFVINTYSPSIYVVSFKTTALLESINSGFVQRDAENAKLQLKALSRVLGCELDSDLSVVRLGNEPKKTTSKRKKAEEPKLTVVQGTVDDLYATFEYQILQATTSEALMKVRATFSANGTLSDKEHDDLNALLNEKLAGLNPSGITILEQGPIDVSEDSLLSDSSIENNESEQDKNYKNDLNDLIDRARKAASPAEANALVRYTTAWTEEQRKPLIQAINARLVELSELNKVENSEPPSLMVQIQNAADLTELDALEIDVANHHPDIQPRLMTYVVKRRKELEAVL